MQRPNSVTAISRRVYSVLIKRSLYLRQGGYVFTRVCLSVCLSVNGITQKLVIVVNFCGMIGHNPGPNRLDFGGNPDMDPDLGIS